MPNNTYTSGQVAKLLGIPARTARRYLAIGRIPATQNPITGTWMIRGEELAAFMEQYNLDTATVLSSARILAVDDEPTIVNLIEKYLERSDRDYIIDTTLNPYDALIRIGTAPPDLVCLDVCMPGMDGKQVLEAIRSNYKNDQVKVLAITGYPSEIGNMLQLGADDAMAKPFKPEQLIDKVAALLPYTIAKSASAGH